LLRLEERAFHSLKLWPRIYVQMFPKPRLQTSPRNSLRFAFAFSNVGRADLEKTDLMKTNDTTETARDVARDNPEISAAQGGPNGDAPDPLDPATWRVDPSYLKEPVAKKILTRVLVGPPNGQDYIRVHPDDNYHLNPAALIKDKGDNEFLLLHPSIMNEVDRDEFFYATLYLYVNKQKVPAFWPVRLPDPDGKLNSWHASALIAIQAAKNYWVRPRANKAAAGYDLLQATANYADPEWPNVDRDELLRIAFKNHLVDKLNHPFLLKLRGEA
jgi:hypothetical protein